MKNQTFISSLYFYLIVNKEQMDVQIELLGLHLFVRQRLKVADVRMCEAVIG